jgi:hypothetical protein
VPALRDPPLQPEALVYPELLDAIAAWEQLEGRPPANMDWRPSTDGRSQPLGARVPTLATRKRGAHRIWQLDRDDGRGRVSTYHPPWDHQQVIEALQRMAHALGRTPLKEECDASPDGYPSASTIRRRFGTFTAGIRAAGLEPVGHRDNRAIR